MEAIDLPNLINDVLEIEAERIKSSRIRIKKRFKTLPLVYAQKTKLLHILVNLIKNAVDAMKDIPVENRELSLGLKNDGKHVIVSVTDSGKGIEATSLQKIFTHGFTTKSQGHGFGLHSSALYMADMGGHMWAESEGADKGATFFLKLPLKPSP